MGIYIHELPCRWQRMNKIKTSKSKHGSIIWILVKLHCQNVATILISCPKNESKPWKKNPSYYWGKCFVFVRFCCCVWSSCFRPVCGPDAQWKYREPITVSTAGGAADSAQKRIQKVAPLFQSQADRASSPSRSQLQRISPSGTRHSFTLELEPSATEVRPRRCWLVRRWSLCAYSRPKRSISWLSSSSNSSISSRCTPPVRG